MSARRVVITADDYGYDPASAEVVRGLLRDGHVSATTVLAVSEHLDRVAPGLAALHEHGELNGHSEFGIGLHLATSSDRGRGSRFDICFSAPPCDRRRRGG